MHYDEDAQDADDETAIVLTNRRTGRNLTGVAALRVNVDDRIACLPYAELECSLLDRHYRDRDDLPYATTSQSEFVYFESGFHRLGLPGRREPVEFEHVDGETALDELALRPGELGPQERQALEDGHVVTSDRLPNAERLVAYDGGYYRLERSGAAEGWTCLRSAYDGFCDRADRSLWLRSGAAAGLAQIGLLGVFLGGRRLLEAGRDAREN